MALSEQAVEQLRDAYPSLAVAVRKRGLLVRLPVAAVTVDIEGIRGGTAAATARTRCWYRLLIQTTSMSAIPPAWVTVPADREIRHVNVWPASHSHCQWTGTGLPSLCWHEFAAAWSAAPSQHQTLGALLEYAKQLLNTENHDSPAR